MKHALILAGLLFASSADALMHVDRPIKVESEIPMWNEEYDAKVAKMKAANTYPADGYTECRETIEIKSAFLCLSNTQKGMNSSLGRASFYIEGLDGKKNTVVLQDDAKYQRYKHMIGGHDLRGADLLRFNDAAEEFCRANGRQENFCPNSYEKDIFENFIVPYAKRDPSFVVITFASQSSMGWRDVVTHEIMHAQYFNDPKYRKICDDFWAKEVSAEEQKAIKQVLARYYDATDELLMKNEFQAYMLMAGASRSQLSRFVPKYRDKLMKQLEQAGVRPIQIKE